MRRLGNKWRPIAPLEVDDFVGNSINLSRDFAEKENEEEEESCVCAQESLSLSLFLCIAAPVKGSLRVL